MKAKLLVLSALLFVSFAGVANAETTIRSCQEILDDCKESCGIKFNREVRINRCKDRCTNRYDQCRAKRQKMRDEMNKSQ